MRRVTRKLIAYGVGALCGLGLGTASQAMDLPAPLTFDQGALGTFAVSGGLDGWGALFNNGITSDDAGLSLGTTRLRVKDTINPWLQAEVDVGHAGSPVLGANSSYYAFGSANNSFTTTLLQEGFVTVKPAPWIDFKAGRLIPLEGIETPLDWVNYTDLSSEINNLENPPTEGGEVDLMYGRWLLQAQLGSAYIRDRVNFLGTNLQYNLDEAGSQWIQAFTGSRIGNYSKAPPSFFYPEANSNLVGVASRVKWGNLTLEPQVQYLWLPNSFLVGPLAPKTGSYSNIGADLVADYKITDGWWFGGLVQWDKNDSGGGPAINTFGNFLGFGVGGPGSFSAGTSMWGITVNPTYQYHNFYVRPAIGYTRISHFTPGSGYGGLGNGNSQVVAMFEIGWILGQKM